jgi:hypothetical protein
MAAKDGWMVASPDSVTEVDELDASVKTAFSAGSAVHPVNE